VDDGALSLLVAVGEEGRISNERSKSPGLAHRVHEVPVIPPEAVEWAKVVILVLLEAWDDVGVSTAFIDNMGAIGRAYSGCIIAMSELYRLRRSCRCMTGGTRPMTPNHRTTIDERCKGIIPDARVVQGHIWGHFAAMAVVIRHRGTRFAHYLQNAS
jgi:hypothetical protein